MSGDQGRFALGYGDNEKFVGGPVMPLRGPLISESADHDIGFCPGAVRIVGRGAVVLSEDTTGDSAKRGTLLDPPFSMPCSSLLGS